MKNLSHIIGLTETESRIYQAVLHGGQLTQTDIAKATAYNRTSLYTPLKRLTQKNLLLKNPKGKRLYYTANNPEKLLKNASQSFSALESSLPELLHIYKAVSRKPTITLRDGPEEIYQATLKAVEEGHYLKSFSAPTNFLSVLTRKDALKVIRIIEERGIKSTTLTSHDSKNLETSKTFPSPNVEWRAMPEGISYPVEFLVYNNTTVITSWQCRFAVEIESADITAFVESLFDYFWKIGESR